MSNTHDELIAELSKLLTEQNYNPVVVTNHRSYARAFLDYLAERDMPVVTVTPSAGRAIFLPCNQLLSCTLSPTSKFALA